MIELTFKIDDIDYDAAAELLLPMLTEQMANSDNPMLHRLFTGRQRLSVSAAKSFLKVMPQEKKDELMAKYLNTNKSRISKNLIQLAAKYNVYLKIKDIKAEIK